MDNFHDLTIRWPGHQKYRTDKIIEDKPIEVIVQKLEMLLYTSKNDILGEDSFDFGVDLDFYLWETDVSNDTLKGKITQQINKFIPELVQMGYKLDLELFEGSVRDILHLNFVIYGYNVTFVMS